MFRNRWLLLPVCFMLTGCASASQETGAQGGEELLLEAIQGTAQNRNPDETVQTAQVSVGDLSAAYSADAQLLYPFGSDLVYENPYAFVTLGECLAEEGAFVEEGQALFVLRQSIDEIDAKEAQRTLDREREVYELMCADYEYRLSELEDDGGAYAILTYEYESYKEEAQAQLEALKERTEAYDEIRNTPEIVLTAPFDGYVAEVIDRMEGEQILSGDVLADIRDISTWYYTLDDTAELVPVGKDVLLEADLAQGQSLKISAAVICADMALDGDVKKGYALVRAKQVLVDGTDVTGAFDPSLLPQKMSAQMYRAELEDVLTVPKDYVHQEGEKRYVYRLENGVKVKTYVVCAADNIDGSSWILSGVEEGDILALD